jgi:hypothetical protein
MAAITFDATHQKEHIRKRLETVFAAFGEMGPQPSPRHFNLSIPPSSARRSRHFSSAATRKASGSPVTPRGSGIFLLESSALSFARENSRPADAQPYFRPRGSNSTWKTKAIRLSRSLDR